VVCRGCGQRLNAWGPGKCISFCLAAGRRAGRQACLPQDLIGACSVLCCAVLPAGPGASNIIPDAVTLSGTIRGFSKPAFAQLRQRVAEVFTGTAAMYRCNASVEWSEVRAAAGLRCLLGIGTLCLEKSSRM
jgi:metal-dependent amidase/aminoacylase/carboxypeptidase family protein